ncbi:interleukin-17 receptor B-like isoform X2 [Myxocyprinus asiaticus]|uniref:interleukin-17 receptor B-like isoform X2 n=1 Tax=Myxocyprinus asiaticus TaxID=70543 RepID=UPI002222300E|nr:interleukin-17 receptor B-like isoform X2 [Myxocyprinus asiaticus]
MDPIHCMRTAVVFILLIHLVTSDSNALNIVATCNHTTDSVPPGWLKPVRLNPSPLSELSVQLSESEVSLIIKWSINIDSSINSINGTWIELSAMDGDFYYKCQYQPPFTSKQNNLTGLQQLWFSFTVSDVSVSPSTEYHIRAINFPSSLPNTGGKYLKDTSYKTPGCESKRMSNHPLCSTLIHDDKIVVTFTTSSASDRYTIILRKGNHILHTEDINGGGKLENHTVEMKYPGTCEYLSISIIPYFPHCGDGCASVHHKVNCSNRSGLAIGIGCVLLFLLILLCCCILRQIYLSRHSSVNRTVSVRVLVVYPAIDGLFQRAVMVLAEFLQSGAGVHVIIEMWERGSLAEQGPLRWLNSQSDLAQRVLIILPPQLTHTENLEPNAAPGTTDHTVSASADSLFALVLNLVTSAAHDPQQLEKFWTIHLDQSKEKRKMPAELRGCRTFHLPRDLQKLQENLSGAAEMKRSTLRRSFSSFNDNDMSWRVKEALQQLDINRNVTACAEVNSLDESPKHLD